MCRESAPHGTVLSIYGRYSGGNYCSAAEAIRSVVYGAWQIPWSAKEQLYIYMRDMECYKGELHVKLHWTVGVFDRVNAMRLQMFALSPKLCSTAVSLNKQQWSYDRKQSSFLKVLERIKKSDHVWNMFSSLELIIQQISWKLTV